MMNKSPTRKFNTAFKVSKLNLDILLKQLAPHVEDKGIHAALLESIRQINNAERMFLTYMRKV